MEHHYRQHVVVYDTSYDDNSKRWLGAAQVRFSEGVEVRIVSVPVPAAQFKSKEEAEEAAIAAACSWIDNRIELPSSSSPTVGPFFQKEDRVKRTVTA